MDATGAKLRQHSSQESQFISESFGFLDTEKQAEMEGKSDHGSHNGSGEIKDEPNKEASSGSQGEKHSGENVKNILLRRASSHRNSEKSSDVNNKDSQESEFISDTLGFLEEEKADENFVPTNSQCPVGKKYSSRESQFISETFNFLSQDEEEETNSAVDKSPAARKFSSRESQFITETFKFLNSDEQDVFDAGSVPIDGTTLNKDAVTESSAGCPEKISDKTAMSILRMRSHRDSINKDTATGSSAGCTVMVSSPNPTSILRQQSHRGRSHCVESINSSDNDFACRTKKEIVWLALKQVGVFTEDKFLVEYESEGSEDTEEENSEEYDSGLQEETSSQRTSSEVSDDKGVGDDASVRTSSDVSDSGASNDPVAASMTAMRNVKRSDSTSTTVSEAEFLEKGIATNGSLHRRVVHHQSSLASYQHTEGGSEVVEVVKEEGESGYGFHLSGGAPVVISTVEPGSCAERAGLSVGYVLITIDAENVSLASVDDVVEIIKQCPDRMTLGIRQESLPFDCTIYSGYMNKQGGTGVFKNWKRRWFDLKADHCLYYYKTKGDKEPMGAIVLSGYTVTKAPEVSRKHTFKLLKYGHRTYYFQADTSKAMNRWAGFLVNMATTTTKKDMWLDINAHNVSLSALAIKDPECHGFLTKLGGKVKTWKRRYCVLKDACLYYYIDVNSRIAQGIVHLYGYYVLESSQYNKKFGFTLLPPETTMRTFHFHAENQTDFLRWVSAMKTSIGKWVPKEEASRS